ncbi:MAG: TVP38/TMEM64 family protein [Anaerolineae bacterium]|nr:TVP38/TMEM64 family protein [Anaerolineae bacterium]
MSKEANVSPTPNLSRWLIRGVVALIVLLLLWANRHYLLTLLDFLRDREAITDSLESLGGWGPLFYLLFLGMQVITAFIPGHPLLIAAGYLYGFAGGLALNLIGVVLFSQLVFVAARRAGKPLVQRFVSTNLLDRWDHLTQQQGFFFFLILFWFPIIPSNATNYLAGLSSISFWLFFLASLVGRLPGLALVTLIGSHGLELTWQQWLVILPVALVLVAGGRFVTLKLERHFNPRK